MIWRRALARSLAKAALRRLDNSKFTRSSDYWESRYQAGGTSGAGSYGAIAIGKAEVLNSIVSRYGINTVTELGCGDGNQLTLASYDSYIGLDISPTAVRQCIYRHGGDRSKSFFLYDPTCFHDPRGLLTSELAISIDVLYHVVEDESFHTHLEHLFSLSSKLVVVFSDDESLPSPVAHVRHRAFTPLVAARFPQWRLVERLEHPMFRHTDPDEESVFASFFVFEQHPVGYRPSPTETVD